MRLDLFDDELATAATVPETGRAERSTEIGGVRVTLKNRLSQETP